MDLESSVSRETFERLRTFEQMVRKWTARINLVSKDSLDDLWSRHILDSIQLYECAPAHFAHWVDMGAGGGFPGVVIAILANDAPDSPKVTLVESDARKCAFLRAALRETASRADVINGRIEDTEPLHADVVSARALADLTKLLGYVERHMLKDGVAILAKGTRWFDEISSAKSKWNFDVEAVKSELVAEAAVLKVTGVSRV